MKIIFSSQFSANLDREAIDLIFDNLPHLESLSASRCYDISPSRYIKFKSKSLKYLNIFGLLDRDGERELQSIRMPGVEINKQMFSTIARPTCGIKRTSIWNLRVRDA
jgi:F-box and leucine-rich repeat protein 1 (S-phase kinase-associated protein 2)